MFVGPGGLLRCPETRVPTLARHSWQPVIPGTAAGRDPESRKSNTGFPLPVGLETGCAEMTPPLSTPQNRQRGLLNRMI